MSPADILQIVREGIIVALKMGAPIMLIGLSVGLVISLVQALTQVQEMTLSFIPKILVVFMSLLVLGPFMLDVLSVFTLKLLSRIAAPV
jgi:flagellar biosynthetic protein FliQ